MKKICQNCGWEVDNSKYCPICGTKMKTCIIHNWRLVTEFERVCTKCGRIQKRGLTYDWVD